jgi:beta-galactosidase
LHLEGRGINKEKAVERILQGDKIHLGVCYYPEHWDRSLWHDDLLRMKKNGIMAVRIAEFAWSKFEHTEGVFSFDFFDNFMEIAKAVDMSVIFCTPTATPPAWLTSEYPEVLNSRMDGTLYRHGGRRHYNYNSPVYQNFTGRIVEKIAEHYGPHPNIIGWQIDNELNCQTDEFYSESDTVAFREFIKAKYKTLDSLNDAWGTVFWNQTYTEWSQVDVPRPVINDAVNPHRVLDYIRFVSESANSFAKLQSNIIRKYLKDNDFITTNGMFSSVDYHRLTRESLNFFTYDSYPNHVYEFDKYQKDLTDLYDRKWSRNLTEVRSISKKFGVMEQQSGANGWNTRMVSPSPRPGQMTLWTMQSIAHGADYVSYFRWRTCTIGTEIYWHGILDYSNRDNGRLAELGDIYKKVQTITGVAGTQYEPAFGVLKDYDNIWDARIDLWHDKVYRESEAGIFQAAQLTHTPMDYVYLNEFTTVGDLKKYPVLFYPHAVILTKERTETLETYVREGGVLILGARTGYKDIYGRCTMKRLPGLLRNLSGADVVEYTFVAPDEDKVFMKWDDMEFEVPVFNDILEPLGNAKVLGRYMNSYYADRGALIYNEYGKGKVFYFGGIFDRKAASVFLQKTGIAEPYRDIMEAPECCEIAMRKGEGRKYLFVLNFSKNSVFINLKKEVEAVYTGKKVSGKLELVPYGTEVYSC